MQASKFGHSEAAKFLVEQCGAELELKDKYCGQTAAHFAVLEDKADVIRFLVSHGASLEVKDKYGKTVLENSESVLVSDAVRKAIQEGISDLSKIGTNQTGDGGQLLTERESDLKQKDKQPVSRHSHRQRSNGSSVESPVASVSLDTRPQMDAPVVGSVVVTPMIGPGIVKGPEREVTSQHRRPHRSVRGLDIVPRTKTDELSSMGEDRSYEAMMDLPDSYYYEIPSNGNQRGGGYIRMDTYEASPYESVCPSHQQQQTPSPSSLPFSSLSSASPSSSSHSSSNQPATQSYEFPLSNNNNNNNTYSDERQNGRNVPILVTFIPDIGVRVRPSSSTPKHVSQSDVDFTEEWNTSISVRVAEHKQEENLSHVTVILESGRSLFFALTHRRANTLERAIYSCITRKYPSYEVTLYAEMFERELSDYGQNRRVEINLKRNEVNRQRALCDSICCEKKRFQSEGDYTRASDRKKEETNAREALQVLEEQLADLEKQDRLACDLLEGIETAMLAVLDKLTLEREGAAQQEKEASQDEYFDEAAKQKKMRLHLEGEIEKIHKHIGQVQQTTNLSASAPSLDGVGPSAPSAPFAPSAPSAPSAPMFI